jgi:hypothetical protein
MAEQSESSCFRALFQSALQSYEKITRITLAEHPLAVQLQSCHTIESITGVFECQVLTLGDFRGSEGVMKSIKSTLSILTRLSTPASFGDAVGIVRRNILVAFSTALMAFSTAFPTSKSNTSWSRYPTSCMCRSLVRMQAF